MNINEIEHNVLENDFENDVQAHNIAFVWQRRSHRVPATRAVAIVHAIQALAVVLCEWIAVFLTTDSTTDMIGTDVCEAGVPNWPMACIKSLAVVALVALAATAYVTGNPDLLSIVGALTAVAALTGTIDVAVTISVRASDSSVKDALAADWVGVLQATVVLVCSAVVGCLLCVAIPRARDIWQHVDRAQAGRAPLVASASGLRAERRFLARTAVDGIKVKRSETNLTCLIFHFHQISSTAVALTRDFCISGAINMTEI
jgi:hypothetical protein